MFNGRKSEREGSLIECSPFWGELSTAEFVESRAIPLQIPQTLLNDALTYAVHSVEMDLSELELTGKFASERQQVLFKKAVFARAKAELLPEFQTLSSRELHENRNAISEQKQLLAEATMAIRAIKGKRRGGVHFI